MLNCLNFRQTKEGVSGMGRNEFWEDWDAHWY